MNLTCIRLPVSEAGQPSDRPFDGDQVGDDLDGLGRFGVRVRPPRDLVQVVADAGDLHGALPRDGDRPRGPRGSAPSSAAAGRTATRRATPPLPAKRPAPMATRRRGQTAVRRSGIGAPPQETGAAAPRPQPRQGREKRGVRRKSQRPLASPMWHVWVSCLMALPDHEPTRTTGAWSLFDTAGSSGCRLWALDPFWLRAGPIGACSGTASDEVKHLLLDPVDRPAANADRLWNAGLGDESVEAERDRAVIPRHVTEREESCGHMCFLPLAGPDAPRRHGAVSPGTARAECSTQETRKLLIGNTLLVLVSVGTVTCRRSTRDFATRLRYNAAILTGVTIARDVNDSAESAGGLLWRRSSWIAVHSALRDTVTLSDASCTQIGALLTGRTEVPRNCRPDTRSQRESPV